MLYAYKVLMCFRIWSFCQRRNQQRRFLTWIPGWTHWYWWSREAGKRIYRSPTWEFYVFF